jgi:hypothetical protein
MPGLKSLTRRFGREIRWKERESVFKTQRVATKAGSNIVLSLSFRVAGTE